MITKKITDYISQDCLNMFLSMYQTLKGVKLNSLPDFPSDDFSKIVKNLKNLQDRGWLQKKDIIDICSLINRRAFRAPKSSKALLKTVFDDIMRGVSPKQKGPGYKDIPRLFLILALVSHVMVKGKTHKQTACNVVYSYLCGLKEISISKGSDDAVRKAYDRVIKNRSKFKRLYEYLRNQTKEVECINPEQTPSLQERYIPTWRSLSLPDEDPELIEKWQKEIVTPYLHISQTEKLLITDKQLLTALLRKPSSS